MPLSGGGVASKPAGTTAVAATVIESAKFNSVIDDIYTIFNTARPIVYGGTGASTASAAFDALKQAATTSATGVVELATTTEALTGTDAALAITPDTLAALWEKGSDVASSGTISLGEGSLFHITGTTSITDIDFATAKDGRRATLIFDGILTLTHNATTLILPGGANITTAAGDRCVVVQDSSDNIIVESYTKADGTGVVAGGLTLVGTLTTTSGATQSLTGIATTYKHLRVVCVGVSFSGGSTNISLQIKLSSNNGSGYGTAISIGGGANTSATLFNAEVNISMTGTNPSTKVLSGNSNTGAISAVGETTTTGLINAVQFLWSDGSSFDAGTIYIYGVS